MNPIRALWIRVRWELSKVPWGDVCDCLGLLVTYVLLLIFLVKYS